MNETQELRVRARSHFDDSNHSAFTNLYAILLQRHPEFLAQSQKRNRHETNRLDHNGFDSETRSSRPSDCRCELHTDLRRGTRLLSAPPKGRKGRLQILHGQFCSHQPEARYPVRQPRGGQQLCSYDSERKRRFCNMFFNRAKRNGPEPTTQSIRLRHPQPSSTSSP